MVRLASGLAVLLLGWSLAATAALAEGRCERAEYYKDTMACSGKYISWVDVDYFNEEDDKKTIGVSPEYFEKKIRIYIKKHIPYLSHETIKYNIFDVMKHIRNGKEKEMREKILVQCQIGTARSTQIAFYTVCKFWSFFEKKEFRIADASRGAVGITNYGAQKKDIEETLELLIKHVSEDLLETQIDAEKIEN